MFRKQHDSIPAIILFENKYMKLNTDEYHLLISGSKVKPSMVKHILTNVVSNNHKI